MTSILQVFVDVVVRPRKLFTDIGSRHLIPSYAMLVMAGVTKAFHQSLAQVMKADEPAFHPWLMMAGVIVLMCLSILVGAMLWATLLNASSSLFNPYDEWQQFRLAVPLAFFPFIISDVMAMFLERSWIWISFGIQIACTIWAVMLYMIMVSSVKEISLFRAFLSVLIAALVIVAIIALVAFLIFMILSSSR